MQQSKRRYIRDNNEKLSKVNNRKAISFPGFITQFFFFYLTLKKKQKTIYYNSFETSMKLVIKYDFEKKERNDGKKTMIFKTLNKEQIVENVVV